MNTPVTYIDYTEADTYCSFGLDSIYDPWFQASEDQRMKALVSATRLMQRLPWISIPATREQELHFPIAGETEIPQAIKIACVEIAVALLDERNPQADYEELVLSSSIVGRVSDTRSTNIQLPHIVAGIPSLEAWRLIAPYVRGDSRNVKVTRMD